MRITCVSYCNNLSYFCLEPGLLEELARRVEAAEAKFDSAKMDLSLKQLEDAKKTQVKCCFIGFYYISNYIDINNLFCSLFFVLNYLLTRAYDYRQLGCDIMSQKYKVYI